MEDEIARFDEEEQDEIMKMLLEEQKLNVFGLIGMILSILSYPAFLLCFIFAGGFAGFFQLLVAIPALVLGIIGVTRKNRKKKMAVTTLILAGVSIIMGILFLLIGIISAGYLISRYGIGGFFSFLGF